MNINFNISTKYLVFGALLTLTLGGCKIYKSHADNQVSFSTKVVKTDTVRNFITATGSVAPVDQVVVGTQVSGEVKNVYVDFNSPVKKGQLIAELDKSALQEKVDQCEASLLSANSTLTLAQQNYNRTKQLFSQSAATQVELDEVTNALAQAKSQLLKAQTNMREARVNLGYADIYSPIDGIVLGRDIEVGQTVAASFSTPTLFTIAKNLKDMVVEAEIDEADIAYVKAGQMVNFSVDSYSNENFTGVVEQIHLKPKSTNNVVTYAVIIKTSNLEEKLLPGMTANISIEIEQASDLVVPSTALNWVPTEKIAKAAGINADLENALDVDNNDDSQRMVWVKNGNDITPRKVKVGLNDGVNYIVKSGLAKGDTIITNATCGIDVELNANSNTAKRL